MDSDSVLPPDDERPQDQSPEISPSLWDSGAIVQMLWKRLVSDPRRRRILYGTGSAVLVGVILGVSQLGNLAQDEQAGNRPLPVVTMLPQPVDSYAMRRTYTGEVVAGRASDLGFERAGQVVEVLVNQGDRVESGTPLVRLDTQSLMTQRQQLLAQRARADAILQELENGPRSETIANMRSQVQELENQLALEQSRRKRREYLFQEGAISQEQFEEASFNQRMLTDRLAAAQSRLQELTTGTRPEQIIAQAAEVRQLDASIAELDVMIDKSTLKAPFAGTIAQRPIPEGTVVNPGESVVRLVEEFQAQVEVGVPVESLGSLAIGSLQQVQIRGRTYPATVTAILPEVSPTTRTRTVVLTLTPNPLSPISPHQIARLSVAQDVETTGFWLPTAALVRGERGLWACYVAVTPDPTLPPGMAQVERRDLEVLYTEGDRVLVRGLLQAGDRVITEGIQRLVPGQRVQLTQAEQ